MKTKIFVLAALLMANLTNLRADGTIIHPSSGSGTEDVTVNGYSKSSTHLYIDHNKFVGVVPGNEIHINGFGISTGAKLYIGKYNTGEGSATPLPGSDFRTVTSLPVSIYLTEDMIAAIGNDDSHEDFRIYGENMTINCVTLYPGKAGALKFGKTIWTSVGNKFIMNDYTTLVLFKEAFAGIELTQYSAIRFYHEAGREDIILNIQCDNFDPSSKLADQSTMTTTKTYSEIKLTSEVIDRLNGLSHSLQIQGDRNGGAAFNFTDVVLMPISPDDCDNCFYVY